eukprot:2673557-Prymnesium_polylepis.1
MMNGVRCVQNTISSTLVILRADASRLVITVRFTVRSGSHYVTLRAATGRDATPTGPERARPRRGRVPATAPA